MNKPEADCILLGGSTKGPVHLGALKEFTQYFDIKRLAGSSAGSIWGCMYATGMSLQKIEDITLEIDFSQYIRIKTMDYFKSYFKMYLVSTEKVHKFLDDLYEGKTFADCELPFYIFVTNASKKRLELLGPESHPDMKLADAVSMSIAIPGVFDIKEMNGDWYWDGGMGPVIPLNMFSKVRRGGHKCVGLPLGHKRQKLVSMIADDESNIGQEENIFQRLGSTIGVFIDSNFRIMIRDAPADIIIAQSNGLGLSMTDFHIDDETKKALIDEGMYAADQALSKLRL